MKIVPLFIVFLHPLLLFSQTDSLSGKVPTFYSKGYKARAVTCQQLISSAEMFYEHKYPQYHFTTGLKIVGKADWQKLGYNMPYGMPHYRNFIVMAAEKNGVFPDSTSDTTISPYDAIAVHELGHYFMSDLVKTDIYPNWANEFIATYFQVIYASATGLNITVPEKPGYIPAHRTLEDFEKGFPLIANDYGWYQGQFMKLAQRLVRNHSFTILDAFIDNYKPGGKQVEASELLRNMDAKTFGDWLIEMK